MNLKVLVGSGDRIALFTAPVLATGVIMNILDPSPFSVGGPSTVLQVASAAVLVVGVTMWLWSALLILNRVPKHELITSGPYAVVKHPLYTAVALLVLPWVGFLVNTWLGAVVGIVLYLGSRVFSPQEERTLSARFGSAWDEYCRHVKIAWL